MSNFFSEVDLNFFLDMSVFAVAAVFLFKLFQVSNSLSTICCLKLALLSPRLSFFRQITKDVLQKHLDSENATAFEPSSELFCVDTSNVLLHLTAASSRIHIKSEIDWRLRFPGISMIFLMGVCVHTCIKFTPLENVTFQSNLELQRSGQKVGCSDISDN